MALVEGLVRNFDFEISVAPINNRKLKIILWPKIVEYEIEKQFALSMRVQNTPSKKSQISRSPPGFWPFQNGQHPGGDLEISDQSLYKGHHPKLGAIFNIQFKVVIEHDDQ